MCASARVPPKISHVGLHPCTLPKPVNPGCDRKKSCLLDCHREWGLLGSSESVRQPLRGNRFLLPRPLWSGSRLVGRGHRGGRSCSRWPSPGGAAALLQWHSCQHVEVTQRLHSAASPLTHSRNSFLELMGVAGGGVSRLASALQRMMHLKQHCLGALATWVPEGGSDCRLA